MDLIVATCRVLASRPRLQLLRALQAHPASTVNDLAALVGLPPDVASHQLKILGNFQLVQAVPRGRYVHYRLGKTTAVSHPFLRDILAFLHKTLGPHNSTPCKVWNSGAPENEAGELIKVFTTYTHLRRLLILRQLACHGASTPSDLMARVGMSPAATSRHLVKLQRRGILCAEGLPPHLWRIATQDVPVLQRRLLDVVTRALKPV